MRGASREHVNLSPRTADFAERVRDSFARQGIMSTLGAEITHIAPGEVDIAVDYAPSLTQQHGFFHAGVTATIADSAGGYASQTLVDADATVLTVEFKINLLAPADGDQMIARGRVIRPGRTLIITRADVVVVKAGVEKPCAAMQQTIMPMAGLTER